MQGIPRLVTQGYLVCVSVIMAWIVTKLPEVLCAAAVAVILFISRSMCVCVSVCLCAVCCGAVDGVVTAGGAGAV